MNLDYILSGLSDTEKEETLKILAELSSSGKSNTLDRMNDEDYEEVPVSIDTFLEDSSYVGGMTNGGKAIYPYWRAKLREMFDDPGKYQEVALTGAIGIGKSSIACYAMAYMLYRIMCLRDPQKYYRLAPGSIIVFAFFNNTLDLTTSVGYSTIQNILQNSPWFLERGTVTGIKNKEYVPNKLIRFKIGSQSGHALGANVFCAMLDEVNFKSGANVQMEKSKIMQTYNGVLERMGSRFMVNGKIQGKLFIVSSKSSEYDFLESYIRKKKDKPNVLVCDAKLWEVKPEFTYSGKKFSVAIGGKNTASKIIKDGEDPDTYMKQGYQILEVPIEFYDRFEMDIQSALMNIAGISIYNSTRFISYDRLKECYRSGKNPFKCNIITTGIRDNIEIKDMFIPSLVPEEIYTRPIYLHIDTSVRGDRTGISAVANMGMKSVSRYDLSVGDTSIYNEIFYHHIFTVGIQCPSDSEISFQKTRNFISYLKHELGWNIKIVSTDGFQSVDTRQLIETNIGIKSILLSLDRNSNGYMVYKSAINEKRISHLKIDELEFEVINLSRDNVTGKIDHDIDKSKDLSDSLSGAVYSASLDTDVIDRIKMDATGIISDVNDNFISTDPRERLINLLNQQQSNRVNSLVDAIIDDDNIIII